MESNAKRTSSSVIRPEDAQLVDGDKVLDYTADLIVPPLRSAPGNADLARPSESAATTSSPQAKAIEIVKKSVLVVDGTRSSMNVEEGVKFYCKLPGLRMGDGWSATQIGSDTFDVFVDFINGESHDKAMWEVNLVTKKVLYRNKYAKGFSYIPAE